MYCPRCATQEVDSGKFCRACGADLEPVALALADQPSFAVSKGNAGKGVQNTDAVWLKKRSKATRNTIQGGILLGTALLIGVALGLFTHNPDWMVIWTVFFGWMACWGAISLAFGIGGIFESRTILQQIEEPASGTALFEDPGMVTDPLAPSASAVSITENTTEPLRNEQRRARVDERR
jgi:hypothetical protein